MRGRSHTLTYLFTDVEGSTALWESSAEPMDEAIQTHLDLLRSTIGAFGGDVVKTTGDGVFAVFSSATAAVHAAAAAQRDVSSSQWAVGRFAVRMGIHSGECVEHAGDYFGRSINRAARVEQAAHGGQVLITELTATMIADELDPSLSLRDLGDHRLDGIEQPQRLFQLCGHDLPDDFPPLTSRTEGISPPPPELTPLIGRTREAEAVAAELERRRLVTVVGAPGVGKSRLAIHLASVRWRHRHTEVRFVDLAPCRRPSAVVATVATALGARATVEHGPLDAIVRTLRASSGLVVLDNCEHVLEEVRSVVDAILGGCPGIAILATSRQALRSPAEIVWPLAPLATPPTGTRDPDVILDAPACRLLIDRAIAARAWFAVDEGSADTIAAICSRLDGLPLALELAGARLDLTTPAELLAELERSTPLSTTDPRVGVFEAVEPSYQRLDDQQRQMFDQLALFAGEFSAESVAAVCAVPVERVPGLLAGLVHASLLSPSHAGDEMRYRLLESVRQYARSHGAVDPAARLRHARHFVERSERLGAAYRTGEARHASRALARDFDDDRLAFSRLVEAEHWADAARLVIALHDFCLFSLRTELYDWAHVLDAQAPVDTPRLAEIDGIVAIGAWYAGDQKGAVTAAERSIARSAGHAGETIWARTALMNAAGFSGDFDTATEQNIELVSECRRTGDPFWIVNGYATEAVALAISGERERALERATKALEVADRLGNPDCIYWACLAMAMAIEPADTDRQLAAIERALEQSRSIGSRWNTGMSLIQLLSIQIGTERVTDAARTALELLEHLVRAGGRAQTWSTVVEISRILALTGRYEPAALLFAAASSRPRMPRIDGQTPDEDLEAMLRTHLEPSDLRRIDAKAGFVSDDEVLASCQRELESVLSAH